MVLGEPAVAWRYADDVLLRMRAVLAYPDGVHRVCRPDGLVPEAERVKVSTRGVRAQRRP